METAARSERRAEANVASLLHAAAERAPARTALVEDGTGRRATFAELVSLTSRAAASFAALGVGRGDRVLLAFPPGVDFAAVAFALLSRGAVPVLLDPGLGRDFLPCLEEAAPSVVVGVPLLHFARVVKPGRFRSVRLAISTRGWPGALRLSRLFEGDAGEIARADVAPDDPALIAFTSGSTGTPKGVIWTHRTLTAFCATVTSFTELRDDDVSLALLPFMALLGPALGCTTVMPEGRKPTPEAVARALTAHRATVSFGAPAIWTHVERLVTEPTALRRLLLGGAPVRPSLLASWSRHLADGGRAFVCYGATEAFPITAAPAPEVLAAPIGRGVLVGRPLAGIEVGILEIGADRPVPPGAIGEIAVRGALVAPSYHARPDAEAHARAGDWWRMGDAGWIDREGRLWLCGRLAERVETPRGTLWPFAVEAFFEREARVERVALVRRGDHPALVVEPKPAFWRERAGIASALRALAPPDLQDIAIEFRRALPLDVRHRAKILRRKL